MAIEIECKVHIEQERIPFYKEKIQEYLPNIPPVSVDKKDSYYSLVNSSATLFRVRKDSNERFITRKLKEKRSDGIEINQEIEFSFLGQDSVVHSFFESLGYTVIIEKDKKGWSWKTDNLTIEIVEVPPLGWFIEIEILISHEEDKDEALKRLELVRKELHIDSLELVSTYYNEMLKKIRK
ncbi:MAG: class IV adenylate cyclase [Spirochaetia bacterium]|nr:class IV adenylate cyclase [Spirochaetia bacterium]